MPARAAETAALEREFDLLTGLDIAGAPAVIDLVRAEGHEWLVLDDRGLEPLTNRLRAGRFELSSFFPVALHLARLLAELHRRDLVLGSLNPLNTFVSADDRLIEVIDFSLASRGSVPTPGARIAWSVTPYIAPEQTGRINRSIDHRTDFYSLGATLYELLVGYPPFGFEDPLEMIHAHVARAAVAPSTVLPSVPEQLSRIVMRLLAKAAEDRYQSASGIADDLDACEQAWRRDRSIPLFELGRHDISERFLVPQRLYGREAELSTLGEAFEATCQGKTSLVLVYGYSGIGKTSLISELSRRIIRQRGYFIAGKFDQVVRNIPHGALIQAFRSLVFQWLAGSEEELDRWRSRLSQALGNNGGVLSEVIPEVEFVIGAQLPPAPLDPAEAQNRFRYVFESFVRTLGSAEHPLVLFLDDLQWVDAATLDLLTALLTSTDTRHLLVIGAYRDNEVDAGHLLPWAIGRLEASGSLVGRVSLGPLRIADLRALLGDTLHRQDQEVGRLSELILQRTEGNPFFVIQFLKALHQEGLFTFDPRHGHWAFRIDHIAAAGITDNVVDLMTKRIRRLSPHAQTALTLGACIGNPFSWATYLTASGQPSDVASAALAEALEAGLIRPAGGGYERPERDDISEPTFGFLHDRVQQAAYDLMPYDRKRAVHLEVGRLLRRDAGPEIPEERLFEIVGHLNVGANLITSETERKEVARLNLAAGRKARQSTAYRAAVVYLEAGLELLTPTDWVDDYDLIFALSLEAAECQYLAGQFDQAERYFELLLARASSPADKAQVHSQRIVLYENLSRFADAIASGREALATFGIALPDTSEAVQERLDAEIGTVQELLGDRRIAALIDLPLLGNPDIRMVMRILTSLWSPAYISGDQTLARLISATIVRLSLTYGNAEDSAYGYVTHAITVGPVLQDYAAAYEWGELALRVNERLADTKRRAKIQQQFHAHVKLWRRPFETCIPHAREARRSGLESGDFPYAGYAAVSESWPAFLVSRNLDRFVREYSTTFALLERIRMTEFSDALAVMVNWALALAGRTSGPLSLANARLDEAAHVAKYESAAPFFLTFYYTARLQLAVLHGHPEVGMDMASHARSVTIAGTVWPVLVQFWESLALVGVWRAAGPDARHDHLTRLQNSARTLRTLAENCPENFRCFSLLVEAVKNRLDEDAPTALRLYDEAISYARETDNVQMEALANELSGEVALAIGDEAAAAGFLQAAHRAYALWGATAKIRQLENRYGLLAAPAMAVTVPAGALQPEPEREQASVDMATVLKVARAVSVQIELDGLVRTLMKLALENAGAERALFLEDRDGSLTLEAEATAEPAAVHVRLSKPWTESSDLGTSIVRYVRRTRQDVVVGNATADERFSSDPYILRVAARSVLCVPVEYQGRNTGILYLENNLTFDAFTPDRVEMMRILAAQAAIALENARLYEGMKAEVERRTQAESSLREALVEVEGLKNRLQAENVYLQEEIRTQHNFNEIVGNSPALLDALRRIELVAPTESTVLILGETGSGKELFARAIHSRSRRSDRPLVKINCGAIPPGLVESELFGHVKGAFTGAVDRRPGRFEVAHGGTLLLDEVGELPLDAQVKLLRVLQEQEFEPVGSSRTVKVNVRLIASTNRNLDEAVREGTFRADLLYRLNVFPIQVPSLRERRSDVPLLVSLQLKGLSRKLGKRLEGFSARGMARLLEYEWPGNVRELQNVVERAAILAPGPVVDLDITFTGAHRAERPREAESLENVQRAHIVAVLKSTGGIIEGAGGAAGILGLHPNTLRSRMKKLGITPAPALQRAPDARGGV